MAFYEKNEVYDAYTEACTEADIWRKDYPQYERLMDNGLLEGLDENLPEVNDGSLAASLFKLAKRVIRKKLGGRAVALDADDAWITELANIVWEKKILPNANSMATPRRKWKDAVRKAAGYGGQPLIDLFLERGNYTGSDFIVPYCQDVKLEAGKVSDLDSDIIFWDVYYTKLQVKNMIEDAKEEKKNGDTYNKWDIPALEKILKDNEAENRPGNQENREKQLKGAKKTGIHFYIAYQRGVEAPFYMCHSKDVVREWTNPDPTGDVPVHYLYCYQDFINPYGIGIVKLAGGTQNVLDYMRQADILATQLGLRPPKLIEGDADQVDEDSMVYAQDANWYVGNAKVTRQEMSNGVYTQLPGRVSMYQTSLQKMIPMGDTSASGTDSGDATQSKTPAGVKLQAANLSIDDEDFSENVDECYAMVAKSMINNMFANMQGSDLLKLNDDERKLLQQAGLDFPLDEMGEPSNELEVVWDNARAQFDFEIDSESDKVTDDKQKLDALMGVAEFIKDPTTQQLVRSGQPIVLGNKQLDPGELVSEIISLSTDNDKILTDVTPEEQDAMAQQQAATQGIDPATGQPIAPQPTDANAVAANPPTDGTVSDEQAQVNLQAVMEQYGVDQHTAASLLMFEEEATKQGFSPEEIQSAVQNKLEQPQEAVNV